MHFWALCPIEIGFGFKIGNHVTNAFRHMYWQRPFKIGFCITFFQSNKVTIGKMVIHSKGGLIAYIKMSRNEKDDENYAWNWFPKGHFLRKNALKKVVHFIKNIISLGKSPLSPLQYDLHLIRGIFPKELKKEKSHQNSPFRQNWQSKHGENGDEK